MSLTTNFFLKGDLAKSLERIISSLTAEILHKANSLPGTPVKLHTILKPKVDYPNREFKSPKIHVKNIGFTFISDMTNSFGDLKSADRLGDIAAYAIFDFFRQRGINFVFHINRRSWKTTPVNNPTTREWIFEFELPDGLKTQENFQKYQETFLLLSDRFASPEEETASSDAEQVLRDALREQNIAVPSSRDFLWVRLIASLCKNKNKKFKGLAIAAWKNLHDGLEMFNSIKDEKKKIEISLQVLSLKIPNDEKAKDSFDVLKNYLTGSITRQEFARYEMTTFHSYCVALQRLHRAGRGNWKEWIPLYVAISRAETHDLEPQWLIDYLLSNSHVTNSQIADVVKQIVPNPGEIRNGES